MEQLDRFVTYLIACFFVYVVETILLGSAGTWGVIIKGWIAAIVAIPATKLNLRLLSSAKYLSATTPRKALVVAAGTQITIFDRTVDRPAFINNAHGFYSFDQPVPAYYKNSKNELRCAGIGPLKPSPLNERRFLESLLESARYEMLRRGHPVKDRLNNAIWPAVHDEGLLIESVKLDDGSTAHILAVDVRSSLDADASSQARQHGIGTSPGSWSNQPLANVKEFWLPEQGTIKYNDPQAGLMPLFNCELREVITPADQPGDPLARADGGVTYDFPEEWR